MSDVAGFKIELANWLDAEAVWRDARALEFAADQRNAAHAAALRRLAADILAMSTADPRLIQLAQWPRRHNGRLERLLRKTLFSHPDDGLNFDHFSPAWSRLRGRTRKMSQRDPDDDVWRGGRRPRRCRSATWAAPRSLSPRPRPPRCPTPWRWKMTQDPIEAPTLRCTKCHDEYITPRRRVMPDGALREDWTQIWCSVCESHITVPGGLPHLIEVARTEPIRR